MTSMLSLASNPFDPFTDYVNWAQYDRRQGFDTAGFLDRVVSSSEALSDADQELAVELAIDSIVANEAFGRLYKKVTRKSPTESNIPTAELSRLIVEGDVNLIGGEGVD